MAFYIFDMDVVLFCNIKILSATSNNARKAGKKFLHHYKNTKS